MGRFRNTRNIKAQAGPTSALSSQYRMEKVGQSSTPVFLAGHSLLTTQG